jgi:hypothetical protein
MGEISIFQKLQARLDEMGCKIIGISVNHESQPTAAQVAAEVLSALNAIDSWTSLGEFGDRHKRIPNNDG